MPTKTLTKPTPLTSLFTVTPARAGVIAFGLALQAAAFAT